MTTFDVWIFGGLLLQGFVKAINRSIHKHSLFLALNWIMRCIRLTMVYYGLHVAVAVY